MQHDRPTTYRFPKSARLRNQAQFERVYRRRCSLADGRIIVYACQDPSSPPGPRLGLTVSRKCGNAVVRNRWKRALREAFRLVQHDLPPGIDFVVLPRPQTTPQVAQLQASLKQLGWRLKHQLTTTNRPARGHSKHGHSKKGGSGAKS